MASGLSAPNIHHSFTFLPPLQHYGWRMVSSPFPWADSSDPLPPSNVLRRKKLHDALLDHCIDGYDLPWVDAVRACRNAVHAMPEGPDQRALFGFVEYHWRTMHRHIHVLTEALLREDALLRAAAKPSLLDLADREVLLAWEQVHTEIEAFQNEFPEMTSKTLPSWDEFSAAAPGLRNLVAGLKPEATLVRKHIKNLRRNEERYVQKNQPGARHRNRQQPSPMFTASVQAVNDAARLSTVERVLKSLPCPGDPHDAGKGWYRRLEAVTVDWVDDLGKQLAPETNTVSEQNEIRCDIKALMDCGHAVTYALEQWAAALASKPARETQPCIDQLALAIDDLVSLLPAPQRTHLITADQLRAMAPVLESLANQALAKLDPSTAMQSQHPPEAAMLARRKRPLLTFSTKTQPKPEEASAPSSIEQAIRAVKAPDAPLGWYEALQNSIAAYAHELHQAIDAFPDRKDDYLLEEGALRAAEKDFDYLLEKYANSLSKPRPHRETIDQSFGHLMGAYEKLHDALSISSDPGLYAPSVVLSLCGAMEQAAREARLQSQRDERRGRG